MREHRALVIARAAATAVEGDVGFMPICSAAAFLGSSIGPVPKHPLNMSQNIHFMQCLPATGNQRAHRRSPPRRTRLSAPASSDSTVSDKSYTQI